MIAGVAGETVSLTTDEALEAIDWIVFGCIIVGSVIIAIGAARIVDRALRRLSVDETLCSLVRRLAAGVLLVLGLIYGLSRLGVQVGPLLGAIGLGGLALAFAVQSVLADVLAGVVLQGRRPFGIGDEIITADHQGRVVDIGTRAVEMRLYNGEHTFVPNSTVLQNAFTNITRESLRRSTLDVGVAYGTDLDLALQVLVAAGRSVDDVADEPAPIGHVVGFGDSGIDLALWYWHSPREDAAWRVRTAVALAVERGFVDAGITIPFPQRVLWSGDRPD